jgi:ankyrin repeat domain-containing protein 50
MLGHPVLRTRKRDKLKGLLQPKQATFERNPQPTSPAAASVAHIQGPTLSSTFSPPLAVPPATSSTSRVGVATPIAAPSDAPQPDPSTSTSPNRDLWLDALQTLTEAEQNAVRNIQPMGPARRHWSETLEELVWLTKEKQQECENGSYEYKFQGKKLILRDVAEKIVYWLSKFKDIGDIAVNFEPVHASLPWAGIRLLLQVFINPPV